MSEIHSTKVKSYKQKMRERQKKKKKQGNIGKHKEQPIVPSPIPDKPKKKPKNKIISSDYLLEESEIQGVLKELDAKEEQEQNEIDKEIQFFTDGIPEIFYDAEGGPANVEEERSISNIPDSPAHLASSFITDDAAIIERHSFKLIEYADDELLYIPSSKLEEVKGISQDEIYSHENYGIFVPEKPKVSEANKNRMINRFLEEDHDIWFDACGDLKNFQTFVSGKRYKTVCDKKFTPIFVPPMEMQENLVSFPGEKTFKISIKNLSFESHPVFGQDLILKLQIEKLYRQYIEMTKANVMESLETKLENLRNVDDESLAYKLQRRDVRRKIYVEAKAERNLIENILKIWNELKELNKNPGIKVLVHTTETNIDEETDKLDNKFILDLEEALDEAQEIYIKEKHDYRNYFKNMEKEIDETEMVIITKPKKPDVNKIREELRRNFDETFRPPGEPIIQISLIKATGDIEESAQIKDVKYCLKLIIDDDLVTNTKFLDFNENFNICFNVSYTVKLTTKIPESIKIEIHEQAKMKLNNRITQIFIPIPESSDIHDEMDFINFEFSSEENINGIIQIKIGWINVKNSNISPIQRQQKPKNVKLSLEMVKKWYDDQILDPMDPDSKFLIELMRSNKPILKENVENNDDYGGKEKENCHFRFNEDIYAFCSAEEIKNNKRFNLLIERFNNNLRFKNMKFIPQTEREILIPENKQIIDETIGLNAIDLQRHKGKKYLKKVYDTITNHCNIINQDKINENLLIDHVPSFGSIASAIFNLFGPKRPLKPTRRSSPKNTAIRINDVNSFNIAVTVVRAFGVPTRCEDLTNAGRRRDSNLSANRFSFRSSNVRPYVTISIKDKVVRTSTADGTTNPNWNEQLSLPFSSNTDQIKKFLDIDLYDEYMEDLLEEDDRARPTEVYQRISSRWLGKLKIPISTIYVNQRIEGIFEIKTPPVLFGYTRQNPDTSEYSTMYMGSSLPDLRELTYISLFISMEPNVEIPRLITSGLECVELEQVRMRIHLWFDEYRNEFPERFFHPLVTLLSGKRVCITRLLGPINIPFQVDESAEYMIRRYVSLIPIHYNVDQCNQLTGVWMTNSDILNLMCASAKDLGVLLTCFYMALDFEVWLILGHSLLSGDATFVLLKEGTEFYIIDPTTGKKYNSKDTYCPLSKIYFILDDDNIYGNIQREKRVYMTQLDVSRSGYWRALFNRSVEAPTGSVHDGNFVYNPSYPIKDLQKLIERKIIRKINSWRTHRKTVWNRYINDHIRKILIDLEKDICLENSTVRLTETFGQLFTAYKVTGYPINMPYINLTSIISYIKSTGIHLNSDNKVEFSIGVHIKEYPNNVLSLWIFLMSLSPKN